MNTSERIKLIQAIAERLAREEWRIIELTLRQFGLPTQSVYGQELDFIIANIDGASDIQLSQLAQHLGLTTAAPVVGEEGTWVPNQFRLFITHLSSDQALASALKSALSAHCISGFVAHVDIEPIKEWQDVIEQALLSADALVALMTARFKESNWVDQEIGAAVGRRLLVIPIRAGRDPYGFIGKYQAIAGRDKDAATLASDIFSTLGRHPITKRRMAEVVVGAFLQGQSWESTRALMSVLEGLPMLDADLLNLVREAPKNVAKIAESWGVPDRIKRMVERQAE